MSQQEAFSRRSILKGSLAVAGASLLPGATAEAAEAQRATTALPTNAQPYDGLAFRHIHLDFHTSPAVMGVGKDFRAEEFAACLHDAAVNSITVFAKCHHGMAYYPTRVGVQHPHLDFDLLGQMIEACHARGILVPVYISTMYDQHMWREHPEWRALLRTGEEQGYKTPGSPLKPSLSRLCVNTSYTDYLAAMADEVLSRYNADGIFFDNFAYQGNGCFCATCMTEREKLGLDSESEEACTQHMHMVMDRVMQRLRKVTLERRPHCSYLLFNGPLVLRQDPGFLYGSLPYYTHIEIESLPGGQWGYNYFPMAARRLRNLGLPTRGMTGAFHRSWGDFGSVRNQAALDYECFDMLAQATMCSVGDHLPPGGRLNRVTYDRIGKTYQSVAAKEPWCQHAKGVADIGCLLSFGGSGVDSDLGLARMLTQLRQQFDIIDRKADFSQYKVLILPDDHAIDQELEARLSTYLKGGGKLILSDRSGLDPEGKRFVLPLGAQYVSEWKHEDQYMEVADAERHGLQPMIEIAYEKGSAVRTTQGESLARCWESAFDKTYQHFQVEQAPPAKPTDYSAIVATTNTVYFATPVFRSYTRYGYVFYRDLLAMALGRLLAAPVVKVQGPSTLQATVTAQTNRRIVHLVHYIPERRTPELDIVEDVIPLNDVMVSVRMNANPKRVYLAPSGQGLRSEYSGGYAKVNVPRVEGHQMVVFEES